MQFRTTRKRQAPAIIIVALVDILVVLLIFLIVTTTFKQRPSLRLALPESKAKQTGSSEKGSYILVEVDKQSPYLRLDGRPLTLETLEQELKARVARDPQLGLAIRADARAPFEQIVKVMDSARSAQITNFSAFVKSPGAN
jgi:biopolymer transport protein ExbD